MKKAFTLSEMLICLAVISALVMIFLTSIRAKPNSSMVMVRKAYNITSNTIYEIMQSAAYYSGGDLSDKSETSEIIEGEKPNGKTKFCKVFASYINTADTPKCSGSPSEPSFTTMDGMDWFLPPKTTDGDFEGNDKEYIRVDVNGIDKEPNCSPANANCKNPDTFGFYIDKNGKITITDDLTKQYLQNSGKISK